ncbi:MAG TPA: outer membrane protein transport protein [Marinilabiliaceae bacterium]|nr:outer membrane protein transport protein [Marinilabiliaceae bacterium]
MKKLLMVLLFIVPIMVYGEGYQINFQGARQGGMGHTGTGLNFGASSIHFNPGALGLMESNIDFNLGGTAILSNNTFQKRGSNYKHESDNPVGTPFFFYGAAKITDNLVAGLGVTTPFGNSLVWGDDWDGRYLIQDISLAAIFIQPTLSYKFNDNLSLGAGFIYAIGNVDLHKALPVQGSEPAQAEISGKTTSFGVNAGVFYKATQDLSFGLSYRSTITMKMDKGDASFKVPVSLQGQFPKTTFKAELPMPGGIQLGTGWQINDRLLLAADLQYVLWSSYKELNFVFEAESVPDSNNERNFENTLIYRIGAEYIILPQLLGRAGFAFDPTPIPKDYLTPETPGATKLNYTLGLSYLFTENISLDLSLMYIKAMEREDGYAPADFYGTYNSNAVLPGFGLNIKF